jgi:hypothetical protein
MAIRMKQTRTIDGASKLVERFELGNGVTDCQADEAFAVARNGERPAKHLMAWDNERRRWANPDEFLADRGFNVIAWGDTGGHSYAITDCGVYLSSNGSIMPLSDPHAKAQEMRERGFEGRRL